MSCSLNLKNISYVKEEKLLFKDINIDLGHKKKLQLLEQMELENQHFLKLWQD